jgi:hypothetical protein
MSYMLEACSTKSASAWFSSSVYGGPRRWALRGVVSEGEAACRDELGGGPLAYTEEEAGGADGLAPPPSSLPAGWVSMAVSMAGAAAGGGSAPAGGAEAGRVAALF